MPSGNRRIERRNKAESGGRTWLLLLLLMSEARMKRGCAKRKCRVTSISIARRYGTSSFGERETLIAGGYRLDSQSIFSQSGPAVVLPGTVLPLPRIRFFEAEPVNYSVEKRRTLRPISGSYAYRSSYPSWSWLRRLEFRHSDVRGMECAVTKLLQAFSSIPAAFILSEPPGAPTPHSYGDNFRRFLRSLGNAASIECTRPATCRNCLVLGTGREAQWVARRAASVGLLDPIAFPDRDDLGEQPNQRRQRHDRARERRSCPGDGAVPRSRSPTPSARRLCLPSRLIRRANGRQLRNRSHAQVRGGLQPGVARERQCGRRHSGSCMSPKRSHKERRG